MNETRRAFLDTAEVARSILASPQVASVWDGPSALAEFSVRGLAGHLHRGASSVLAYLDRGDPGPSDVIGAAQYYAAAVATPDINSDLHVAVRERGEAEAEGGHEHLVARYDAVVSTLRDRLSQEPDSRLVRVFQDLVLTLDDYLVTRLIELTVHTDDLAVSVALPTPAMPPHALELSITTLVAVARLRHGDLDVLRGLTRRERDDLEALRVL